MKVNRLKQPQESRRTNRNMTQCNSSNIYRAKMHRKQSAPGHNINQTRQIFYAHAKRKAKRDAGIYVQRTASNSQKNTRQLATARQAPPRPSSQHPSSQQRGSEAPAQLPRGTLTVLVECATPTPFYNFPARYGHGRAAALIS